MFEKLSMVPTAALRNIVTKVLLTRRVRRRVEQLGQFYGAHQAEKDRDIFSREQEVSMISPACYLPNTEERIKRLRRLINRRPVAIILHGPSVIELEERITELKDCDICYSTVNVLRPIEKNILGKINRDISLFMCGPSKAVYDEMNSHNLIDFLERPEDNLFISGRGSFFPLEMTMSLDLDKFIKKYDRKLLFVIAPTVTYITMKQGLSLEFPSVKYPLHFPRQATFSIPLSLAVIGGASMVVVFGGDGGRINTPELYYREHGRSVPESVLEQALMLDAGLFNVTMPLILDNIYQIYNLGPVDIINCSEQSHYTPFRKLSYDETFALLKSFKKDTD